MDSDWQKSNLFCADNQWNKSVIAEIVEKKICKSYEDAYQLMKKDYDQYAIDAIESEFPEMHKYTHKCGDAYVVDDDGEILWNIEELMM